MCRYAWPLEKNAIIWDYRKHYFNPPLVTLILKITVAAAENPLEDYVGRLNAYQEKCEQTRNYMLKAKYPEGANKEKKRSIRSCAKLHIWDESSE